MPRDHRYQPLAAKPGCLNGYGCIAGGSAELLDGDFYRSGKMITEIA
jgi:hypothetical protein